MIITSMEIEPAAFSCQRQLFFKAPAGAPELKALIAAFLEDLKKGLHDRGCSLIGHIKGLIVVGGTNAEGTNAEGTNAEGTNAEGTNAEGTNAGGTNAGGPGYLMFSITSFDDEAHYKGKIREKTRQAALTVNIIVYGIEKTAVAAVCQEASDQAFGAHR
jgi:hypothetical protein